MMECPCGEPSMWCRDHNGRCAVALMHQVKTLNETLTRTQEECNRLLLLSRDQEQQMKRHEDHHCCECCNCPT